MRRRRQAIRLIVAIIAILLTVDYIRVRARIGRVSHSISRFGGRCGSIPFWPIGAEYRITLPRALTSIELCDLAELNSLRGTVHVAFVDCELSTDQTLETIEKLHGCKLYRVINGKWSALENDSQVSR